VIPNAGSLGQHPENKQKIFNAINSKLQIVTINSELTILVVALH